MARTYWRRLLGWIGRRPKAGEALWLIPCAWIHTAWMRAAIDAVFCEHDGTVIRVVADLQPGRTAGAFGAAATCELPAGASSGVSPGDHLEVTPGRDPSDSDEVLRCRAQPEAHPRDAR